MLARIRHVKLSTTTGRGNTQRLRITPVTIRVGQRIQTPIHSEVIRLMIIKEPIPILRIRRRGVTIVEGVVHTRRRTVAQEAVRHLRQDQMEEAEAVDNS